MKRLGVVISKPKTIRKSVSEWAEEIAKAGTHKYVKREGSPGNYTYYYRLPDGSVGTKEDLEAGKKGKAPPSPQAGGGKAPEQSHSPKGKDAGQGSAPKLKGAGGGKGPKVSQGDNVTGKDAYTGQEVSGVVTAKGKDGVTVTNDQGIQHHIRNDGISKKGGDKSFIDPSSFKASDWAKQWDDPKATKSDEGVEYIMSGLGLDKAEIEKHIKETDAKNYEIIYTKQLTHQLYRKSGEGASAVYAPERQKLHNKIERSIMAPDKINTSKPPEGEKPTFIMLGGRGGSGKSWFKNNVYDPNKFVILDADAIKEQIPEYDGWNANQVHEESSDILEKILYKCQQQGLNVVLDATMKSPDKAMEKIMPFLAKGYKTEAHYMHLPKQEAAKRAVLRYRKEGDYKGRYVPVKVVLGMTTNEETFDRVKNMVDVWSFRDNNVKRGDQPILISEGKKMFKKSLIRLALPIKKSDNEGKGRNVMEKIPDDHEITREEAERIYNDPDSWEYDCKTYPGGKTPKLDPQTDKFMNGLFEEAGVPLK